MNIVTDEEEGDGVIVWTVMTVDSQQSGYNEGEQDQEGIIVVISPANDVK